ncbi:MAG: ABC transporter substrate-binding protein [Inquilinus limosus]|uniref:ABC transporter substrate-binding protein n=1 Tax=Inquilinus limosus TaxID=171674 RepID=A0A952FM90_9PROT|nr:ABC transporter substrate-binding protein [Inquilinus limosus]
MPCLATRFTRRAAGLLFALLLVMPLSARAADPVRIAFGDIPSVESLNFLIAIERTRARGVPIELTFFKSEDIAAQAVVSGQADIGVGTPYALLQKVGAPIRLFFQMSTLRFYPVVNTEFYQDWKDLDGQEVAVHSRGSGTEAIMMLMAQRSGIKFGKVSYVPGSEVRAGALLQGAVKATIVDSAGWRLLQEKGGGKFKLLEVGEVNASDEALFANTEFLESNADAAGILAEELLNTWREIAANPAVVGDLRKNYKLLADLPAELEPEIVPFYQDSVAAGMYPLNGGGETAVKDDFAFYAVAGQLQGDPALLKVEDFWTFTPVNQALDKVGRK